MDRSRTEAGVPALERVIFFSDAVFAIAITLLAFDVRLPELAANQTNASLFEALLALGPAIFAFILSFAVIAALWVGHYQTFRVINRIDGRLMALNLGFLFCIAALPFPTSVIAQEGDVPVAAALYAAFGVLTGTMSLILWRYPARAGLVISTVTPGIERYITYRISVVPIMFALSVPIAFVNPYLAWFWWIAIFVIQQLVARRFSIERVRDPSVDPAPPAGH